ncbi:MAG: autotransporter-associated beta strand repeat-containing protein [Verrucomicrobiota bacterium]
MKKILGIFGRNLKLSEILFLKMRFPKIGLFIFVFQFLDLSALWALQDTSSNTDDQRFLSGIDTLPVANNTSTFIGKGYDWSSVGWIREAGTANGFMNMTLLTPRNIGSARHWHPANGDVLHFFNGTSVITVTAGVSAYHEDLSDLYLGTLQTAVSNNSGLSISRILDVSSNNYAGMQIFQLGNDLATGTGMAISTAHIINPGDYGYRIHDGNGNDLGPADEFYRGDLFYRATGSDTWTQEDGGDSGSPTFIAYKGELTYAGSVYGSGQSSTVLWDGTSAHVDPTIAMNASIANTGYALRWTIYDIPEDAANTANVWSGTTAAAGNISSGGNWSKGAMENNKPVVFDSSVANIQTSVNIDSDQSVRGILFRSNAGPSGFTFSGSGLLSIDRTGIRNEDTNTQTFNNNIKLLGSQNWEAVNGNLVFNGNINTGTDNTTRLALVVQGDKNTTISGAITGTGYLGKDDNGTLILSGANTYTGGTFIHTGTIQVAAGHNNVLSSSSIINFDTSNTAVLDLNNTTQTVGEVRSLYDGTGVIKIGTGSLTTGGAQSESSYAGTFEGSGTLIKQGGAKWTLTGNSSNFSGTVRIQGGALNVMNTVGSATGSGNVILEGGILSGSGYIAGNVVLKSWNKLYAGDYSKTGTVDGIGTLTVGGGLTWNSDTNFRFDLGAGGLSDRLDLGTTMFDKGSGGNNFKFTFYDAGVTAGTYDLVKFGSTDFSVGDFSYDSSMNGFSGYFSLDSNNLYFTVTAVPEPSTWLMMGLMVFVVCFHDQKRKLKV